MGKNKMAVWGRNVVADLFPIRRKWRMWLSYFGPLPIAFGWPYVVEPTPLNMLVVTTFYLYVVWSYTRMMARHQFKADARFEVRRLHREYCEILEMLDQLPPEERSKYDERAKFFALRLLTLNKLLADLDK